ncbi:glycoside hydrolase domain-containing protein [Cohnella soli]|uniref:Glycoside hydrolase domain-containing protein n=1 Tax=Cohnella soli TaxID=425005 RepID=A0ABW0HZH8_9BACL
MRRRINRVLSLFLILCIMITSIVQLSPTVQGSGLASQQSDLTGHWSEPVMGKWIEQGLLKGVGVNQYRPNQIATRAEFVVFINSIFKFVQRSDESFIDVKKDAWYADAISKVHAAGIINGVGGGKFNPEVRISREDAAVIVARAFRIASDGQGSAAVTFSDHNLISSYAVEAVDALQAGGNVKGRGKNAFAPKESITRAEIVQLIDNVMGTLVNASGTITGDVSGNLVVNADNVTLKDMNISGNLYVAQGVGEGDLTLDGVTVQGETYIWGGGENSIKIHDSKLLGKLIIDKWNSLIRVIVSGKTEIAHTLLLSGGTLEEDGQTNTGFESIEVNIPEGTENKNVTLIGKLAQVWNKTNGIAFLFKGNSTVGKFIFDAIATVDGDGTIELAILNASGVNLSKWPLKAIFGNGIWAIIEKLKVTENKNASAPASPSSPTETPEQLPLTVWVPTNVDKIRRDQAFPSGQLQQELRLEAARNEYEGGQIIVRTAETAPKSVSVSVSPLKKQDGTAIGIDQIQLFKQYYTEVTTQTSGAFPKGFYPDALIPITAADRIEIRSDRNQGFWITVKVPKGQPAGIYKGAMTIAADGLTREIPIQIEVWDFELSDEGHTQTAFAIWNDQVAYYHGVEPNTPEYWELLDNYYWLQTEYRLPPDDLPIPDDDVDQYIAKAGRYLNDPRVNSFRIPFYNNDPDKTKDLVDKLRDKGWLSKGYFYLGGLIDEPSSAMYPLVKQYAELLKQIAPDVKHLLTKQPVKELYGDIEYWAPPINTYHRSIAEKREALGEHFWWYTMVYPTYPSPSYHIDDLLVGARLLSWMQKDYKVEGNLYWSTTIFRKYTGMQYVDRDVWNDPLAFPGANGDGFLLYPGKELGLNKPIPSLRLETIRDGMEDYEYLWIFEERMKAAAEKLGLSSYDVEAAMKVYYDRLYSKMNDYNEDPYVLMQVRREIAEQIISLAQDPAILFTVAKTDETTREMTIYTEPGAALQVNGVALQPQQQNRLHDVYQYSIEVNAPLNEVRLVTVKGADTNTLNVFLAGKSGGSEESHYIIPLNDVDSQIDLERWTISNATTSLSTEHVVQGDYSMRVDFHTNVEFPNIRLLNEGQGFVNKDWSKYRELRFNVYNPNNETLSFYVKFFDELGGRKDGYTVNIAGNTGESIRVPLSALGDLAKTQMEGFEIWMWESPEPRTLYFDNFHFIAEEMLPPQNFPAAGNVEAFLKGGAINITKGGQTPFKLFMMNTGAEAAEVTVEQVDQGPLQVVAISDFTLVAGEFTTLNGKIEVSPTLEDGTYTVILQVKANGTLVKAIEIEVRLNRNMLFNQVTGVNGAVQAVLNRSPASEPGTADFTVQAVIDGTAALVEHPTEVSWNAATNTATLAVPFVEQTNLQQSVVYRVAYNGGEAFDSPANIVPANPQASLIRNSSFEIGYTATGAQYNAYPWRYWYEGIAPNIMTRSDEQSRTGKYSLKLSGTAVAWPNQEVVLTDYGDYEYSVWLYTPHGSTTKGTIQLYAFLLPAEGDLVAAYRDVQVQAVTSNGNWTQIKWNVQIPEQVDGTHIARVWAGVEALNFAPGEIAYLDDFAFVKSAVD